MISIFQEKLDLSFGEKQVRNLKNSEQYKNLFRQNNLPDSYKREVILKLFNLKAQTCEIKYEALVGIHKKDFGESQKKIEKILKLVQYDILNDYGK